jgi:hypothetical protein
MKNITLLKDINKKKIFLFTSPFLKIEIFLLPLIGIRGIQNFTLNLENEKVYLVIPFISPHWKLNDSILILSKQLLVTKYSNELTVQTYLADQLDKAIIYFGLTDLDKYYLKI